MTETKTFHDTLLAVQKAVHALNLTPEATGQVQSREYKYLTIQKLHSAVMPILFEEGLTWFCQPGTHDGNPILAYTLSNEKDHLDGAVPLIGCSDMQKLGSAITYARRYALLSILGLTPDEDTDCQSKASTAAPKAIVAPRIPRDRALKIRTQAEEADLWDDGAFPALTAVIIDAGCESGKIGNLNVDQAEDVEHWIKKESAVKN